MFVRVHFEAINDAKTFAILIALITSRYLRDPKLFVRMMVSDQVLTNVQNTQTLINQYKLKEVDRQFELPKQVV